MGDATPASPEEPVLVRVERSVAVITLNRPRVLNAVNRPMAHGYAKALRAADADPRVRGIVVTGAGRGFCSGADMAVFNGTPDEMRSFMVPREEMPHHALRLSKPVVAAVNGPVAGIGFAYMMGSDIRFAAKGATMSTVFPRLGLVAEYGLSWLLPRLIGGARAMELLLSGRTIEAEEALRIGLVHRVSEPGEVLSDALDYTADLVANCAPSSLAVIKEQVYADLERPFEAALDDAISRMNASFGNPDLAEAIAARKEKRPPAFADPKPTSQA
ncbi:enoyl-CoA hydratase-related protein [Sinosporangium siamense]|uniref:Enoyl-CoA hydratase n=1 Tax=Sinosporangium siamense TaxID=1367973 RepID=A0A919VA20_9ACTN|nr:enoyl-CoA hydratase-related protein [Sinosporangium siamense]GII94937.1 enoyl-CoA hydratase [Sinosporangium siamense]